MKIKQVPIDQVVPYDRNPRKRDQKAIDSVKASLLEFGWRQPIVVDQNMVIIVGHTRYFAALQLEMAKVPVQVADDLTDAQAKAYRIADNRTGENTTWDPELLKLELLDLGRLSGETITISDPMLQLTGLDQAELIRVLEQDKTILPPEPPPKEGKRTRPPGSGEPPKFASADLIELGTHALNVGFDHMDVIDKIIALVRKEFPKLEILHNGERFEDE